MQYIYSSSYLKKTHTENKMDGSPKMNKAAATERYDEMIVMNFNRLELKTGHDRPQSTRNTDIVGVTTMQSDR